MEKKDFNNLKKFSALLITSIVLILVLLLTVFAIATSRKPNGDYNTDSTIDNADRNESIDNAVSSDNIDAESSDIEESKDNSANESSTEESKTDHGWIINKYGYTYLYKDSGYEQFNYSSKVLERYVNALNTFENYVPEETSIYNIIVPVSSEFAEIPREVYIEDGFYNKSQSAFVSTVETKLDERIINIPIVNLIKQKYYDNDYVFFRTDKNWTPQAAYYAYCELCKQLNLTPIPLSSFNKIEAGEFLGRFYLATDSTLMENNPDNFVCYGPMPSIKTALTIYKDETVYKDFELCSNDYDKYSAYDIFFGIDADRYEVSSTAAGGSILLIGDSSIYPIVPLLTAHYKTIDVVNPQNFTESVADYLKDHKYECIVTMCYSTNATSGDYIPAFNEFLTKEN